MIHSALSLFEEYLNKFDFTVVRNLFMRLLFEQAVQNLVEYHWANIHVQKNF